MFCPQAPPISLREISVKGVSISSAVSRARNLEYGMANRMTRNSLLPAEALMRTSEVDHADWNYRPLLGWVQGQRFAAVLSSLPAIRIQRLLEVGYGSGVFMPVLKSKCEEL